MTAAATTETWQSGDGAINMRHRIRHQVVHEYDPYRDYSPRPYPPVVCDQRLGMPAALIWVAIIAALTALLLFGAGIKLPSITWDRSSVSPASLQEKECDATREQFLGRNSDGIPTYRLQPEC